MVSRRFVARTEHAVAELLAIDLTGLDLVALMVDGIRVAEQRCVVTLGITLDGTKIPLALVKDATENATSSLICWPGCAGAAWTPHSRSWS